MIRFAKIIFTVLCVAAPAAVWAQEDSVQLVPVFEAAVEAPDHDAILREIIDGKSEHYYPNLMARYRQGDTTLTLTDYRYLYYGYIWQPEYKPFETPAAKDRLLMAVEGDSTTPAKLRSVITFGNQTLEQEPFDPTTINLLVYAYGTLGDTLNERINFYRLQGVLGAIRSSGTGLTEESPWHIIYFSHVKDFMSSYGIRTMKEKVVSRTVAYVPRLAKTRTVKGYFFNYGAIYMKRPEQEPQRQSNGWEINGIPLKKRVLPEPQIGK